MRKSTAEDFLLKAIDKHGPKFDYSKVDYNGVDTKVIIICPKHGEFEQTPYKHISSKHGCKKCGEGAAAAAKLKSIAEFIVKAKAIHGDRYDYSSTVYSGAKEKLTISCPSHGDFEQLASGHLSGYGCSKCASYGKGRVDMDKPCKLYYLHIVGTTMYKLGITTRSVDERYRTKFDRDQISVVFVKEYSTGREAYEVEQSLHSKFSSMRHSGEPILRNGNTEIFVEDIFEGNYHEFTD